MSNGLSHVNWEIIKQDLQHKKAIRLQIEDETCEPQKYQSAALDENNTADFSKSQAYDFSNKRYANYHAEKNKPLYAEDILAYILQSDYQCEDWGCVGSRMGGSESWVLLLPNSQHTKLEK